MNSVSMESWLKAWGIKMIGHFRRGIGPAIGIALFIGTLVAGTPVHAEANEAVAKQVVIDFYAVLTKTMQDGEKLGFDGRYQLIQAAFQKAYDADKMARKVLGPEAVGITADQYKRFRAAFADFSVATYASRFKSPGAQLEVENAKFSDGIGVVVESKIIPSNKDPVAINYVLSGANDTWRISDVYLKGSISELATRRSEYSAIMKREGIEGLIQSILDKTERARQGQ